MPPLRIRLLRPPRLRRCDLRIIEPMQHSLHDVRLDVGGFDRGLAATGKAGPFGAVVAALPTSTRPRDQLLPAVAANKQAAEQVFPRGLVRPPCRVGKKGADLPVLGRRDDRGPLSLRHDLAVALTLAADPGRAEYPPKRLRRPLPTSRRRDLAVVEADRDRTQRLPSKEPVRALLHDRRFRRAQLAAVGFVAVRSAAATRHLPRQRELLMLAANPAALVVALFLCHRTADTSLELPIGIGK